MANPELKMISPALKALKEAKTKGQTMDALFMCKTPGEVRDFYNAYAEECGVEAGQREPAIRMFL